MSRRKRSGRAPLAAAAALLAVASPAAGQPPDETPPAVSTPATGDALRSPDSFGTDNRLLRAIGEITAVNLIQNAFGRYVFTEGNEGFIVTWDTIRENLHAGMNWDDNTFSANNFRHPYQGGMYYNAGRANHFGFYESTLLAFAGSWSWEYLGEAHNPAFNDWINTAVGGVALGEIMYRLSSLVLDNRTTGSERVLREIGGALISPVRGFNRLVTGEATHVHANPPDRFPTHWASTTRVGVRALGVDYPWEEPQTKAFVFYSGAYGNGFEPDKSPFDHFEVGLQLTFDNKPHGIERIESRGRLGARDVGGRAGRTHHVLASYLHFDYIDNEVTTFGGQSVGATFQSRFGGGGPFVTEAVLDANAILVGATKSDYFNISGREYDYGPGLGIKFATRVLHEDHPVIALAHDSYAIRSANGGTVGSWVSFTRGRLEVPVRRGLGAGVEWILYHSERDYPDLPLVRSTNQEVRLFAAWGLR